MTLGVEFILAVANLNFGPLEKYPLVKHSLMELNLQSDIVIENVYRFITATHVQRVIKKENAMDQARQVCIAMQVPEEVLLILVPWTILVLISQSLRSKMHEATIRTILRRQIAHDEEKNFGWTRNCTGVELR